MDRESPERIKIRLYDEAVAAIGVSEIAKLGEKAQGALSTVLRLHIGQEIDNEAKAEAEKEAKMKATLEKLNYEKVLRIIGVRSKLENFVDKNYPLRTNIKTGETVYGKPDSSYCDALNEMLVSTDRRFTDDEFIVMIRQRLIDCKVKPTVFMRFSRWLYNQFSDKTCHKMAQFCPPLPKFDDDKGITEMLEAVEIDVDAPALICIKIILQPLDLPVISP